ncbi:unnamed protein product [Prunus armeniaca]|uniref:Uncharacterized protein n=1 Tax=Prunus armeniaca TaxID=36596 RepID=A0A6J5WR77_PRUAR|nr:unnamed protein product [Prunus armeniaca]CAB4304019.1 unnamed protein product [Prunus armeniaca]
MSRSWWTSPNPAIKAYSSKVVLAIRPFGCKVDPTMVVCSGCEVDPDTGLCDCEVDPATMACRGTLVLVLKPCSCGAILAMERRRVWIFHGALTPQTLASNHCCLEGFG